MKTEFISAEQTLPLRSALLRNGWAFDLCTFPSDELPGAFHLGQVDESGQIVCILSCHPQPKAPLQGNLYQLRGMATEPAYQGRGLGRELVEFCIQHLKKTGVQGLWCNARRNAYSFYQKLGFEFMSDEFEIPDAGPHRVMFLTWV